MSMILQSPSTENNRTGSGAYKPLKRQKKKKGSSSEEFEYLDKRDIRMRFKNSKDPIYVAFDVLDRQPLKKLAADFVKESLNDIIVFVSKFN